MTRSPPVLNRSATHPLTTTTTTTTTFKIVLTSVILFL